MIKDVIHEIHEDSKTMTLNELAAKWHYSPKYIGDSLREEYKSFRAKTKLLGGQIEKIYEDYLGGMNYRQLADKYNFSRSHISETLRDTYPHLKRRYKINVQELFELKNKGWDVKMLASYFHVDQASIRYHLNK